MEAMPVNEQHEDNGSISLMARDQYLRQVAWIQVTERLETEEEARLLQRLVRAAYEPGNAHVQMLTKHARERLVEGYQPVVMQFARMVAPSASQGSCGMEFLDLVNEGNIGLLKAIEDYPKASIPFDMLVRVCIRHALWHAGYGSGQWSHVPDSVARLRSRIRRVCKDWCRVSNEPLSVSDLALRLEVSEAQVEDALYAESFQRMESLQGLLREDDAEDRHSFTSVYAESIPDEDEHQRQFDEMVQQVLERELGPRQREIIQRRYGIGEHAGRGQSQRVVASLLGVKQVTVHTAEHIAKKRLSTVLTVVKSGSRTMVQLRPDSQNWSEYYTMKEASLVLGVCETKVQKYVHQGLLPFEVVRKKHREWRLPKQAVHDLAACSTERVSA
ncbi:MAG: sigma-70 family RNA polymerase sigma factor [Ktedonobacteraceae bacterium]|nr:sigma-70 family RNA polymerase sigma factor [Ktedonobacteraceae bacterium]